ncbi:MAG: L-threonylcarbamoyladenylate synthase [Actinomycetota bacterium]|nr:L-threonylcarbamoyladenylate synthase [Actinomycetota bacterium]MDA8279391.1 L-threonylcarbamoyladenylate synthase [Actinomycetota bacterium]
MTGTGVTGTGAASSGRGLPQVVDDVEEVARALSGGAVVGIPTDTVYGLAALATVPGVGAALAAAKGRHAGVAVQVLVADVAQADLLAGPDGLSAVARRLVDRLWPGGLTVVTDRRPGLVLDLGGDPTSIGLRCPAHRVVAGLCRSVGPLAATSANRHGQPPLVTAQEVADAFAGQVEMVLDGGLGSQGASTVVDVRGPEPLLLRDGAIPWAAVVAAARCP